MNIQEIFNSVEKFNTVTGGLTNSNHEQTLDGIELQLSLIDEELKEGYEAFTQEDATELADAAGDILVVAMGLVQRLNSAGFNMPKVLQRICDNNMSKVISTHTYNVNPEAFLPEGATAQETPYGYVVFKRNTDMKVVKPVGFEPVSLAGCVPENFFGTLADNNEVA